MAVQNAERQCGHGEEVHRRDGSTMIAQKDQPPPSWIYQSRCSAGFGAGRGRSRRSRTEQNAKGEGRDGEEVHGGDGLAMVAEKRQPTLGEVRRSGRSAHPS